MEYFGLVAGSMINAIEIDSNDRTIKDAGVEAIGNLDELCFGGN